MIKMRLQFVQSLIALAIVSTMIASCEAPYDAKILIEDQNKTSSISISYKLNYESETRLGSTDSDGTFESHIRGLKGDQQISIFAKKPGYKVEVLSPRFPHKITSKQNIIRVKLRAIPDDKLIHISSEPAVQGIKIVLDDGLGKVEYAETRASGTADLKIKSTEWKFLKLSFLHSDYTVQADNGASRKAFNSINYNTIQLSLYPKKTLQYKLKVINPVANQPILGAKVTIPGMSGEYLTSLEGIVRIPLLLNDLMKGNHTIDSDLVLEIDKVNYVSQKVSLKISNDYSSADSPEILVKLQPANELIVHVVDRAGRSLAGIPVSLGDDMPYITDAAGKMVYRYESKRAGESLELRISEENMLPVSKNLVLSAIDKTETITVSPFSYYLVVRDKSTQASIENLKISSPASVSVTELPKGKIQLLFKKIDQTYDLRISDKTGNYETTNLKLDISAANLGATTVVELVPKTFVKYEVYDGHKNPLPDVEIIIDGKRVGRTGATGKLKKEIVYVSTPLVIDLKKPFYKSVQQTKFITPGENVFSFEMAKLELLVTVIDNESKLTIPKVEIKIDGSKYTTDPSGNILLNPKRDNSKVNIEYSAVKGIYLNSKIQHVFDANSNNSAKFYLQPRPSIIVKTLFMDPQGMKGEIPGVSLLMGNNRQGLTNQNGLFTYQLEAIGQSFTIRAEKKGFVTDSVLVPANRPTIYEAEIILQGITAFINISDVNYNKIEGLNVSVDASHPVQTNNWGQAVVRLAELNKEVQLKISDPLGRYISKSINHVFQQPQDALNVTLLPKPVDLTVAVGYSDGSPAIARVEILPPPTNTGETVFKLAAGAVTIPVYKAGTYEVKYITQGTFITDFKMVKVDLGANEIRVDFNIPNASMKVRVDKDRVVDVSIYASGNNQLFSTLIGVIPADGKSSIDLSGPGYTEYKLVFNRPGWSSPSEVIVKLTSPSQLFDLSLGDQYQICKKLESSGDWEKACIECAKVDENDPFFCDATSTLIFIYRDQLEEDLSAAHHANRYLDLMNSSCGKSWSYYSVFFALVAKLEQIPNEFTVDNRISEKYSEFINLAILTISDPIQKNKQIEIVKSSCAEITCNRIKALKAEHTKKMGQIVEQGAIKLEAQQLNIELKEYLEGLPTNLVNYYNNKAATTLAQM